MRVLILFALQTWSAPIVIVEKDIEDQSMRIGDSILMYVLSVQRKKALQQYTGKRSSIMSDVGCSSCEKMLELINNKDKEALEQKDGTVCSAIPI